MRLSRRLCILSAAIAAATVTTEANSAILTTTFASNNGQSGNMFDVVTMDAALTVTGFDLNLNAGTWDIEIYSKSGTWVGSNNDPSAWTLIDSGSVSSSGNTPSFFDVADFILNAAGTTALYITGISTSTMRYTNGTGVGNIAASNADLQILEGAGVAYPFSTTFMPRIWNGSIHYEVSSVPEPSTLLLLSLGLGGLVLTRRKAAVG